jgi:hypothetical protein
MAMQAAINLRSGSFDDPDYFLEQHGNRSMGRFLAQA